METFTRGQRAKDTGERREQRNNTGWGGCRPEGKGRKKLRYKQSSLVILTFLPTGQGEVGGEEDEEKRRKC